MRRGPSPRTINTHEDTNAPLSRTSLKRAYAHDMQVTWRVMYCSNVNVYTEVGIVHSLILSDDELPRGLEAPREDIEHVRA